MAHSLIYSLGRCWPCPRHWDTTERFAQMSSGSCGLLSAALKDLCDLPYAPIPQGSLSSLHFSSWASVFLPSGMPPRLLSSAHVLPSLPGPALCSLPEALLHARGGQLSRSRSTLHPGWSMGMSPLWPFTGHGWMARSASGCPLHPWPLSSSQAYAVPRLTEVPNGCCSRPSSGAGGGFGPLTKTPRQ